MDKRPLTVRVARWSATHPWRAMGLWDPVRRAVLRRRNAAGLRHADNNVGIGQAGRADRIYQQAHYNDQPPRTSWSPRAPAPWDQQASAAATDAANRMKARPDVHQGRGSVSAANGRALLVVVTMAGDPDTAADRVQPLRDVTAQVQAAHPAVRVEETGGPSIDKALNETLGQDFKKAELLSLPISLLILLIAFGALIAAGGTGDPSRSRRSSVRWACPTLASHLIPGTDTTKQRDPADRHGRRRRLLAVLPAPRARGAGEGPQPPDAVEIAAETSGRAVVVSGLAVVIAMAGLFLATDTVVLVAGRGLDPGGAGRGDRLADRPARHPVQARPVGGQAAAAGAVAADRPAGAPRRCGPRSCGRAARAAGHADRLGGPRCWRWRPRHCT